VTNPIGCSVVATTSICKTGGFTTIRDCWSGRRRESDEAEDAWIERLNLFPERPKNILENYVLPDMARNLSLAPGELGII
jgi:hypothetical protein